MHVPLSPDVARVPRRVFSPIARDYDRPALALSLFQYRRWHRFLLSRLPLPSGQPAGIGIQPSPSVRPEPVEACPEPGRRGLRYSVLDMATGTGALALDLATHTRVRVVGADITRPMLARALTRADERRRRVDLVEATAEAPPFAGESFDAIVFAYLLRYVGDVPATLRELARLLRPGGVMASLDFAVPSGIWYPLWRVYTDAVLPATGLFFSPDWRRAGSFLGPSIRDFYQRWPEPRLRQAWRDAGLREVRSRRLTLGGAIVIWGTKA